MPTRKAATTKQTQDEMPLPRRSHAGLVMPAPIGPDEASGFSGGRNGGSQAAINSEGTWVRVSKPPGGRHGGSQAAINSEGTWVRISKPPGATGREPATVPVAIPGAAAFSGDAHELPD